MTTLLVHHESGAAITSPDEELSEVAASATCATCGQEIVPLLGKVVQGCLLDWSAWIEGNYEHVEQPEYPHPAVAKEE